ncbi:hypothetical protein cypCar_00041234 [Cyprinus carpio]|nr:hypothetical protein cypCar_00041234 [Cyprinus carpio]
MAADSHQLTLDLNTVNKHLRLSESNRVITGTKTVQSDRCGSPCLMGDFKQITAVSLQEEKLRQIHKLKSKRERDASRHNREAERMNHS